MGPLGILTPSLSINIEMLLPLSFLLIEEICASMYKYNGFEARERDHGQVVIVYTYTEV